MLEDKRYDIIINEYNFDKNLENLFNIFQKKRRKKERRKEKKSFRTSVTVWTGKRSSVETSTKRTTLLISFKNISASLEARVRLNDAGDRRRTHRRILSARLSFPPLPLTRLRIRFTPPGNNDTGKRRNGVWLRSGAARDQTEQICFGRFRARSRGNECPM